MDYKIVRDISILGLQDKVNNWIKKGYEPSGGVSIARGENSNEYIQAIITKSK